MEIRITSASFGKYNIIAHGKNESIIIARAVTENECNLIIAMLNNINRLQNGLFKME